MTYRILAYGPRKSCLTWAHTPYDAERKKKQLEEDGYTKFNIEEEEG